MIVLDAVLETWDTEDFTAWPIADLGDDGVLVLSGRMTSIEVGTAMAVILRYNEIPAEPTGDLSLLLDRHLAEAEVLIAPGGLRVRDTETEAEIPPGSCCGLESWREWRNLLRGGPIWLGHDPDTELVRTPGGVRLRQESHRTPPPVRAYEVEIPLDELPGLLASAHVRLQEFLHLVREWADETVPGAADRLVAVLDENFDITGPLELD